MSGVRYSAKENTSSNLNVRLAASCNNLRIAM